MTKKEKLINKLMEDAKVSYYESFNICKDINDGGTCNLDSCMIKKIDGITYKEFEDTMKSVGLRVCKPYGSGYRGWYIICKGMGQGWRNTKFAETLSEKLKDKGYTTSVWYQID